MLSRKYKPPRLPIQIAVLCIGIGGTLFLRELGWQRARLDLPLFTAYPAVVAITLALGVRMGIVAAALALANVLIGPAAADFLRWPATTRLELISVFSLLSAMVCMMVKVLDRRQTIDLSMLLKDLGAVEERMLALATSLQGHLVCLLDGEGRIVGWYGGNCRITGWSEREILGMALSTLYPVGRAGEARAAFDLALAKETGSCRSGGERRNRKGELFVAETTLTRLNRSEGYCVIIRDMRTELPSLAKAVA